MNWKNQFFKEISKFIPTTTTRITRNKCAPWFNLGIRYLIQQKNTLYKIAVHSKQAEDWRCTARNRATNATKNAKYEYSKRKASLLANPDCLISTW